jgi:catechol 2,3-dioxygenase-like lactoylglutathione lyase family enzyme
MLSHVTVGTNDLPRAIAFYDRLLGTLGIQRHETDLEHGLSGYAVTPASSPQFWLMRPIDGRAASVGNGATFAFEAADRETVGAFHAAGLAAGGTCEGPPGERPHYHRDHFGAYLRDPDGNKICCACHRPATACDEARPRPRDLPA